MPIREIYLKLSVTFADDPKVCALVRYGVDGILARDLYVQMCLFSKRMLTDGFVVAEQVGRLSYPVPPDHANQLAKQLASVGLIKEVSNPEAQGWQIVAYLKRNGTKEDVERLSEVRAEAGRQGGRPPHKPAGQGTGQANRNQIAKQNKSQANPYTETETESESDQDLLPPSADAPQAAPKQKRGTRIPDDFAERITPEMVAWAKERCPHVDGKFETEKFVNHWQYTGGRTALKLDWVKAWKNWLLNAEQQAPRGRTSPNGRGPAVSPRDEWKVNRA